MRSQNAPYHPFKLCLLGLLLATITGCGFQLRGALDLPEGVEPIAITGVASNTQLAVELRNQLKANGVQLATKDGPYNYQLAVLDTDKDKITTAIGEAARTIEYQLIESIEFELLNNKGQRVLGPSKIVERRIMPNDPTKVVSTGEEEEILRREMLQNMAAKITRQLRAYKFSVEDLTAKDRQTSSQPASTVTTTHLSE